MDINKLNENDLEQVTGGKQDVHDYIYETTVNKETPFYKAISMTPINYSVWFFPGPGNQIRVREENLVDFQGKTYVRCIANVRAVEEGYILQDDVVRKTV